MDWLRRNWPDLAIGIALVAVIAGIVATLLTGGTFFAFGPDQPAPPPAPPAVTVPDPAPEVAPDPVPEPVEPPLDADVEEPGPDVAELPPVQPGVAVLAPDGTPADEPTPSPPSEEPAPAPDVPAPADPEPEVAPEPPAPTPAPEPDPPAPDPPAPDPPAPTPAPVTAAPGAPLPTPSSDPEAPYRVSVGAFGDPDNAARQADTFRAAGFPVFTGTQDDFTIVLVGPYQSEAEAVTVASRIRSGDFGIDPVIYRYRPDAVSAASSTPAPAPTPAAEPAPTPAEPTLAVPPAASRYLQVGAFASHESSRPLREQLASLGFAASEVREDGLIKLLVGPFEEPELSQARQRLAAQGIESFAR